MWLFNLLFSSLYQLWYVEVRISRSISVSPLKLLRSKFSSFPRYFIYIFLTSGVKLHIHLLNVVVQFIILLTLSTLICRGTDISKCFSESLGIRDIEVRLYYYEPWYSNLWHRDAERFNRLSTDQHSVFVCRSGAVLSGSLRGRWGTSCRQITLVRPFQ